MLPFLYRPCTSLEEPDEIPVHLMTSVCAYVTGELQSRHPSQAHNVREWLGALGLAAHAPAFEQVWHLSGSAHSMEKQWSTAGPECLSWTPGDQAACRACTRRAGLLKEGSCMHLSDAG